MAAVRVPAQPGGRSSGHDPGAALEPMVSRMSSAAVTQAALAGADELVAARLIPLSDRLLGGITGMVR